MYVSVEPVSNEKVRIAFPTGWLYGFLMLVVPSPSPSNREPAGEFKALARPARAGALHMNILMHPQFVVLSFLSALAALSLASCTTNSLPVRLGTRIGPPVHYEGPDGARFVARYGSLSDGTLHFVKVQMPDGRQLTLPQVVSASGVRYTDDRELIWWTHQDIVTVQTRDAAGQWQTRYPELREADAKNAGSSR